MLRNKTHHELLQLSKHIVQPLLPHLHKGQAGKITVIGGSEDYTGAPFFSAHSAALVGADLAHVVCERAAAPTIKLYSPDLMVHPYLYELHSPELGLASDDIALLAKLLVSELLDNKSPVLDSVIDSRVLPKVSSLLARSDMVVVGPGFGRDPLMLKSLVRIIEEIKVLNKPLILDADALFLVAASPQLVQNYPKAILTPNVMEFSRLAAKLGIDARVGESDIAKLTSEAVQLSKALGNVTVVRKGLHELIVKGDQVLVNETAGSNKRVGGQGDTLTGAIATLVNWSYNYNNKVWDPEDGAGLSADEANLLACFAACSLVRMASSKAYKKYHRSMQTSNIHEFLSESYVDLFENQVFLKF
ncbi:Ribokinase-like protein [Suhomyces tanzawaensis NRRL Y-17324]|uniref:ATP-dependent (S)-NAD(P)H-hydrate dehydratase n=1 Tax=Suhomyces tanzawaensis NRRL Y-17324 TaxID=984487 RepID=A0A1E4SR72_9ASCO|nr:Ribokinase-like protein [Suhomyces tanzawaensis NRRL Y-17324]ODV81902.1 Ribokinase-like protein [Suhomyces tanzawaensis NRRL Y-17324]